MTTTNSLENNKTFSLFVERALPKFVSEDHPRFVEFTKKYFEFLERDYNSLDLLLHYLTYNDIDTIMDDLKLYYYETYTATLPQTFCDSFSFFIKHVREFYRMKGSENSFEYLFREFFDSPVEFFYPSKEVFRVSAANWYVPYFIVPETQDLSEINKFKGHVIRGQNSLAEGFVTETRYVRYSDSPLEFKYVLIINNREGFFVDDEEIKSLINPDLSLQLKTNDAIIEEEGRIAEKQGILSGNFYLQDNFYWQDFSYELQSTVDINDFRDLIKKTVHPAGFIFFSALKPYLGSLLIEHDLKEVATERKISRISDKNDILAISIGEDVLKTSESSWIEPYYIIPKEQNNLDVWEQDIVKGKTSGSVARVNVVEEISLGNNTIKALELDDRSGHFQEGEEIESQIENNGTLNIRASDGIVTEAGYWATNEGHLSWDRVLQGSVRTLYNTFKITKQYFSYEINLSYYKNRTIEELKDYNIRDYVLDTKLFIDQIDEYTFEYFENNLIKNKYLSKFYTIGDFDTIPIEYFETKAKQRMPYEYSSIINIY